MCQSFHLSWGESHSWEIRWPPLLREAKVECNSFERWVKYFAEMYFRGGEIITIYRRRNNFKWQGSTFLWGRNFIKNLIKDQTKSFKNSTIYPTSILIIATVFTKVFNNLQTLRHFFTILNWSVNRFYDVTIQRLNIISYTCSNISVANNISCWKLTNHIKALTKKETVRIF